MVMYNINLDYKLKLDYLIRKFEFESAPRHLKIKEFINDGFIVDMNNPIITKF